MKRITVCLSVCLIASLPSVGSAETLRTVALTGDGAPDTLSGVIYNRFSGAGLNSGGQTAFFASVTGTGVDNTNSSGIWSEADGSLGLIARRGDHAPGTPSELSFNSLVGPLVFNSAGQTAFRGLLKGDGVSNLNNVGVWSEGSGALGLVARSGVHAPGTPSEVNFLGFRGPLLNAGGQTAFLGTLKGGSASRTSGIWSEGSGTLALVARALDPAPGTPSGVSFGSDFSPPVLNAAGQTAFRARLAGSGIDSTNNIGIWSEGSGSLNLVARKGNQAPGMPSGVIFYRNFGRPVLNSAGQTAFSVQLAGAGIDSSNDNGIWSEGSGSLGLVARAGDHAPGTPSGVNFTSFLNDPLINSAGQTVFSATLVGSGVNDMNRQGIWSEGFGSLGLVAREGDRAPGTPAGVRFADIYDLYDYGVVLNSAGQTAFAGLLTGSDVDSTNDFGIWAQDRAGSLRLIARHGDALEVAPGDYRTISSLEFAADTGNGDGRPSDFNDSGQLAFTASFTDGTYGVFVSNVATVPEPGALGLLLFGVIACGVHRRRR